MALIVFVVTGSRLDARHSGAMIPNVFDSRDKASSWTKSELGSMRFGRNKASPMLTMHQWTCQNSSKLIKHLS